MNTKKKIGNILFLCAVAIIVIIAAIWLILMVSGYRINWQAKKIQKTGMIYLKTNPRNVNVYLDGQLVAEKTPLRINNLLPHRYEVEIKKNNYQAWTKTFNVASEQVEVASDVKLFLTKPELVNLSDSEEKQLLNTFQKNDKPTGLVLKNNEVWWQDDLITRFWLPVKMALFSPDKKHILFQIDKEIRLIDLDGSNNVKLLDLASEQKCQVQLTSDNDYLIVLDGTKLKKYKIA